MESGGSSRELFSCWNVVKVFLYILASISEGLQALGGNLNYFTGTGTKLDPLLTPGVIVFASFFLTEEEFALPV